MLERNGRAYLNVDSAEVLCDDLHRFHHSEETLFDFLFAEQLKGEGVALQHFLVVDCDGYELDVREPLLEE